MGCGRGNAGGREVPGVRHHRGRAAAPREPRPEFRRELSIGPPARWAFRYGAPKAEGSRAGPLADAGRGGADHPWLRACASVCAGGVDGEPGVRHGQVRRQHGAVDQGSGNPERPHQQDHQRDRHPDKCQGADRPGRRRTVAKGPAPDRRAAAGACPLARGRGPGSRAPPRLQEHHQSTDGWCRGAGVGCAASMLVLGAGLAIARIVYLNSVPASVLPADAAAAAFDILVRFIRTALRTLLVVGLVVAVGAFFTGPSAAAAATRSAFSSGFGWLRRGGESAGLSTGPVGRWTYAHRRALRVGAVALAALVFVFWGRPTAAVTIVIAAALLVGLGLSVLDGRPPPPPP